MITIGAGTASPLTVNKPGYGTMRLTGEDFYGEPKDRNGAIALLRKAVKLGVNFFDTADFYGPGVTNRLLTDALYPYLAGLVIATKVGAKRGTDKSWQPFGKPAELRISIENNLKELKLEQLPLVHYAMAVNSPESYQDGLQTMLDMQHEGKILHLGLSNANVSQFNTALKIGNIATVENMFSYMQQVTDPECSYGFQGGELLPLCEENQIPFIPFLSLQTSLPAAQNKMAELANAKGVTAAQLNIAWLLHRSQWILPIPGTTSISHLEENIEAADVVLTEEDLEFLS